MSDTDNFEKRTKGLFDESVAGLNGNIRSRLTQARHRALSEAPLYRSRAARRWWIPAAGLAAAAVLAVLVVRPYARIERSLPDTFASADDLSLLMNDDDLEMIEDMEFYAWLESDPQALPESSAPTTVDDAIS